MKKLRYIFFLMLLAASTGCEKFLDYPPEGAILAEDALKTPDDMQRLLNSCYDVLANVFDGSFQNMSELMSDNLAFPNGLNFQAVYNRETNFFTPYTNGVYADFYYTIYRCNTLLANFDLIEGLSSVDRARMEAEARFVRGFCHYYVSTLWAQPYGSTADNSHLSVVLRKEPTNLPLPRNNAAEVYAYVLADLEYAYNNLPEVNSVYATKYAAAGLLSMVHFQMNQFSQAVNYADEVINSGMYFLNDTIDHFPSNDTLFLAYSNPETIFGIVSFQNDVRTDEFIGNYNSAGALPPALTLSSEFNSLMNQNAADQRKAWIEVDGTLYISKKFADKIVFNVPLIYLTELKLMRAEALGELNTNLSTAISDINDIRDRAFGEDLNDLPSDATAQQIITAAREEYRKETICEGKWLLQLKRRGAKGEDITIRNAPWNCPGMALQFPNSEFTGNSFVGNPEGGCQ